MPLVSSILWKYVNNHVSISKPVEAARLSGESDAAFITRIGDLTVPQGLTWREILDSAIAADAEVIASNALDVAAANTALQASRVSDLTAQKWQSVGCYVPNDIITTVIAFADITGIEFPIGANEVWIGNFNLMCLGSAAGIKFQMTGPASPVKAVIGFNGHTTARNVTATWDPKVTPGYGVPSMAFINNATPFSGLVQVYLNIINGPTAGIVKLQLASATAAQTNKVSAGSHGFANRVA